MSQPNCERSIWWPNIYLNSGKIIEQKCIAIYFLDLRCVFYILI